MKSFYLENTLEVGLDEAGRGPMLGRVYIGAVIIPPDDTFKQSFIKDSKKLSERKRLMAYDFIKENAIDYTSFYYGEKKIDEINIFKATYEGMHRALDNLMVRPEHILVDGIYFPIYSDNGKTIPYTCVESGDNKYLSIAAASIIAKVERDKYIYELCEKNPELIENYELNKNKGYGTAKHIEGIKKHGISEWHRKSFGICKNY
jgi:ribonuclease HII